MKVIILCKQAPQSRDLLTRPYGRFFHLPLYLAQKGVGVSILLLNHKAESPVYQNKHNIHWYSESIYPSHGAYLKRLHKLVQQQEPDWIIGFSDTYYGILAQKIAKHYGILSLIDAYDNYESYVNWCKPLHHIWRQSLKKATTLTAAGQALAELMAKSNGTRKAHIIPMAADPIFQPMDKIQCRQQLQLPVYKKIIGYTGSLHDNRGIEILCQIAEKFRNRSDIIIIVSGRKQTQIILPNNITQLGYLADSLMPTVINALDVLLVLNNNSAFGTYSYPAKLYEAMACQIPTVCADVQGTREILPINYLGLAKPGDVSDFIEKTTKLLEAGNYNYGHQKNWGKVSEFFFEILTNRKIEK